MRIPNLRRRVPHRGTAAVLAALPVAAAFAAAVPARASAAAPAATATAVKTATTVKTRLHLPSSGQAALIVDGRTTVTGPVALPQPIASVAKVMTAYQVLLDHPLRPGDQGPTITVQDSEAVAYRAARLGGESVIPVAAGERISERTALSAMLLPSANDMARILARWDAGGIDAFVARMNATAAGLAMGHTHYADPAGVLTSTVSTAPDQLALDQAAMANPVFAAVVGQKSATVPVAGTVHNSNVLLGTGGFVGVKPGWTTAAGQCLMFAARVPDRRGGVHLVYGVLLGQPRADFRVGLQRRGANGGRGPRGLVDHRRAPWAGLVCPALACPALPWPGLVWHGSGSDAAESQCRRPALDYGNGAQ